MRKGERIVNLDRFVEMLKESNIPFTQEQYEEAKKHLEEDVTLAWRLTF